MRKCLFPTLAVLVWLVGCASAPAASTLDTKLNLTFDELIERLGGRSRPPVPTTRGEIETIVGVSIPQSPGNPFGLVYSAKNLVTRDGVRIDRLGMGVETNDRQRVSGLDLEVSESPCVPAQKWQKKLGAFDTGPIDFDSSNSKHYEAKKPWGIVSVSIWDHPGNKHGGSNCLSSIGWGLATHKVSTADIEH